MAEASSADYGAPVLMRQDERKFEEVRARLAAYWTAPGPVNELAVTLMAAWEVGEMEPVTASYVATFADMAAAALATLRCECCQGCCACGGKRVLPSVNGDTSGGGGRG